MEKMRRWEMTASWAVWPPSQSYDRSSNISFPAGNLDTVLHARSIVLGLNRGVTSAEPTPWRNFHTGPKHNDHFLAEAFRDTSHWGAYMTDLLTEVNSKSKTLDFSNATIRRDVEVLVEQVQAVEANDPLFIVIGKKAADAFKKHEALLATALRLTKVRWVEIPHYSASNGATHRNRPAVYRDLVLKALAGR